MFKTKLQDFFAPNLIWLFLLNYIEDNKDTLF
jgi:hypothetical protein